MDEFSELNASNLKTITKQARERKEDDNVHIAKFYEKYLPFFRGAAHQGKLFLRINEIPVGAHAIADDLCQRGFIVTFSDETDHDRFMNISWKY